MLFLLLLTFIFDPKINIGINLGISDVVILIILMITLVQARKFKIFDGFCTLIVIYFLVTFYYIFLIWYSWSIIGNDYHEIFGRFRNLYFYTLPFFSGLILYQSHADIEKFINCLKLFFIVSVVLGTINIVYRLSLFGTVIYNGQSYATVMSQEGGLIAIIIMVRSMLQCLFMKNNMRNLLYVFLYLFAIIASQNRSLIVCTVIAFTVTGAFSISVSRVNLRFIKFVSIVIFLSLIQIFSLVNSPYWSQFERRYEKILKEVRGEKEFTQLDVRMGRTIETLKSWERHPFIGSGWGSQIGEYTLYRPDKGEYRTWKGTPHNYYVALLEQTGLIGFLIMICFWGSVFFLIKPKQNLCAKSIGSYSFFIFLIVFLAYNVTNVHLYSTSYFISASFFIFGVSVADASIVRTSVQPKNIGSHYVSKSARYRLERTVYDKMS